MFDGGGLSHNLSLFPSYTLICQPFFVSLRACLRHKHSYVTYDNLTSFSVKQGERGPLVLYSHVNKYPFRNKSHTYCFCCRRSKLVTSSAKHSLMSSGCNFLNYSLFCKSCVLVGEFKHTTNPIKHSTVTVSCTRAALKNTPKATFS